MSEIAVVREACRARPANYQFMPKFKAHMWDGYISLMHTWSQFPTGLLPWVLQALDEKGLEYELEWGYGLEQVQTVTPKTLKGITLRDYQVDAANMLLEASRGVAKMATNAGKTEIMAAIVKAIGKPAVILVHRKELMYQTAQRFENRGLGHTGVVGDGLCEPSKTTVAMIQTIARHVPKVFKDNWVVIADECHHVSSDQTLDVMNKLPGPYRFGFSGTPLKHDLLSDMKLIAATGEIVYELTNDYLIKAGYSARPVVMVKPVECRDKIVWKMEYQDAYSQMVVHNDERNRAIVEFARKSAGTRLIMVNFVEHGKLLREMLPEAIFVHGEDTTEYRQGVIQRMRTEAGIFIASPIFDEGVDVPALDTVILAGGGKSHVKLLQRIGRGLRSKPGSNTLIIMDFIDDTNRYLLEHSDARISTYEEEGFEIRLL